MATSNYEINVQLALATTAAQEGDTASALEFLANAQRLTRGTDRVTTARVQSARVRQRPMQPRPAVAFYCAMG
jgi:hypothetical protein